VSIKRIVVLLSIIISTNILTAEFKVNFATGKISEAKEVKKNHSKRVTTEDIHRLELMILKLKKRIEILELRLNKSKPNKPNKPRPARQQKEVIWGCYLQDSFGRTYSGEGKTKSHASSEALKKCSGGLSCKAEKLNCSRSSVR
jgi:hypothetical protein